MSEVCGAVKDGAVCKKAAQHPEHIATKRVGTRLEHLVWENEDYVAPTVTGGKKPADRLNDLAGRIHGTGVPVEAQEAWDRSAWVEQTYAAFEAFLATRTEPFTTAEDFWPLIEAPEEVDMRAMSMVVQRALRKGLLVEVGAKRLREVYRTANGVQFPMNKLVPIYEPKRG